MWFGLFELPVLWLCLLLVAGSITIATCVENESGTRATITLIVVLTLMHIGHVLNLVMLLHSPLHLLLWIAVYLVCGAPWAVMKWNFFLNKWQREAVSKIQSVREKFLKDAGVPYSETIPDELKEAWAKLISYSSGVRQYLAPIQVRKHVGRLLSWAAYWPFSVVYTLLDDPFRRFFQWLLIDVLGKHLQNRANMKAAQIAKITGVTEDEITA